MKKTVIILSALALFAAVSCNKAEVPAQRSEKHPVTLTVGLGAETRVSHPLDGTTIKPAWENTDYVFVKGDVSNTWEKFSIVATGISSDGKSASFINEDSVLGENETCTVIYATPAYLSENATDPTSFSIASGQDGTLANLPEYLVAENVSPGDPVELASQLTYFHFVYSGATYSGGLNSEIESVKFGISNGDGKGTIADSEVTLVPAASTYSITYQAPFLFGTGTSTFGTFDMYVAVLMGTQQSGTPFCVKMYVAPRAGMSLPTFGSDDDYDASYYVLGVEWESAKTYSPGHVYKKSGTNNVFKRFAK